MKQGKRVQKKEKTKQAILEAPLELFAAKGFYATTTKGIYKKAQIAEGTLFNYFETKEDLALYFFEEELSGVMEWVEALLKGHDQVGDFLENSHQTTALQARAGVIAGEKPFDRIGHYKLLQQIGEGGCGVVFMAEQEEPIRRRVALKIIKPGMDTKSVIDQFEAERQTLALMDHPNIAKIFDAGATESCRPYFVMELVRG